MSVFLETSCLLCGNHTKDCSSIDENESNFSLLQNTGGGTLTSNFENSSWATYFCKLFKLPVSSYEDKFREGLYCQKCSMMLNSIYSISSTIEDLHRQLNLLKLNIEDVLMKNPRVFGPESENSSGDENNSGDIRINDNCFNNKYLDLDIEGIFQKLVLSGIHSNQSSSNLPFNFNTEDFNDEATILLGGQNNDLFKELDNFDYQVDFIPAEDHVSSLSCEENFVLEAPSQSLIQLQPHDFLTEIGRQSKETTSASSCESREVSVALQKLTSNDLEQYANTNVLKSQSNVPEGRQGKDKDNDKLQLLHKQDSNSTESCSKKVKDESEFYRQCRMKLHQGVAKPYECTECGKCFKVPAYLKDHQNFHTGKKPHRCAKCGVHFHTTNCLKSHVRTVHRHKEGTFTCEVCQENFQTKVDLNVHRSFHPELNLVRLQCTTCSKTLRSARNLKNHLKTHDGSMPFACTVCSFKCLGKAKLNAHMERHNSEKKIACPQCNKLFNCRANLKTHMIVHNEKKYECQTCKKFYKTKDQLKRHEGIHSGEKPFLCYVCGKAYAVRTYLTIHLRSHKNKTGNEVSSDSGMSKGKEKVTKSK